MRSRRFLFGMFLSLVVLSLGWQLGMQTERRRTSYEIQRIEDQFALSGSGVTFQVDPEKEVEMSLFWSVWRLLDKYYVDPNELEIDKLRFGAVRGLVDSVGDPYTGFMSPKENADFQQDIRGTLEGIGAELTVLQGRIVVVAPIKGAPAAKAGLLPRDIILTVDGFALKGVSLEEAVERIRGEKGTEVVLGIRRPETDEDLTITIIRDHIRVPSVEHETIVMGSGTVGYIAINQFGENTVNEARSAVRDFASKDLRGLILDLRFNGGGLLDASVDIASFFIEKGKVVSVHRRGEEVESEFVLGDPIMPTIPMVAIINEGSASASEILAGALQDHKRATVIGIRSFGKGTVQEVLTLPGGSSLRVTVAQWRTPGGRFISKEGIAPDFTVDQEYADYLAGNDHQKEAALQYLLDGAVSPDLLVVEETESGATLSPEKEISEEE